MTGLDEAVVDAVLLAGAVEAMTPGGIAFAGGAEAIGEFLAIILKTAVSTPRQPVAS